MFKVYEVSDRIGTGNKLIAECADKQTLAAYMEMMHDTKQLYKRWEKRYFFISAGKEYAVLEIEP